MSRFYTEYAPKCFSEVVLKNPMLVPIFQAIANGNATQHLLLYGPVGTGKTAIAKLITELYYSNRDESNWTTFVDLTNTTDFSLLRSSMIRSPAALTDRWWFILDEGDKINRTKSTQLLNELHNIIGKYSHCNFILTTNSLGHMPAGIQSRCYPIALEPPSPEQFLQRARDIVNAEGKYATDDDILKWLSMCKQDIRQYLTFLEIQLSLRPRINSPQLNIVQSIVTPTPSAPQVTT